jgi:hypothetical protein
MNKPANIPAATKNPTRKPPARSDRPRCLSCGKTLSLYTLPFSLGRRLGDDCIVISEPRPEVNNPGSFTAERSGTYWDGRYGRYGDGRFCGLSCGYKWAAWACPPPTTKTGGTR